ncbi:MAG: phosphoribosyltransferase family protein [Kiritimatiellia bacterium]|jgi:hypothetical protein|nr:phosphoribosyltransferase family protein [Kiritimatiellia bacterium]
MSDKEFIESNDLVRDSFCLADQIYRSGYRPDVILVLWRGGTPVGIVVHEFLLYKGIETYHAVVKAESYSGIGRRTKVTVDNLGDVLERIDGESRVLVVDDIFDTGWTVQEVRRILSARTGHVKVATLYQREGHNQTDVSPDFCYRQTDRWIVFPHELMDLSPEEIKMKDESIYKLLT